MPYVPGRNRTMFDRQLSEFYRLAYLMTGDQDRSIQVVANVLEVDETGVVFPQNTVAGLRRMVIAAALHALRVELEESALRTMERAPRDAQQILPFFEIGSAGVERALLGIDIFPRCAFLLTILEGMSTDAAKAMLHTDTEMLKKGQAEAARQFVRNLWPTVPITPRIARCYRPASQPARPACSAS